MIGGDTKPCPSCGKPILEAALQCRHCRVWLYAGESTADGNPVPPVSEKHNAPSFEPRQNLRAAGFDDSISDPFSKGQAVSHLVWLSVLSLGLYEIYWFYRNWRELGEHTRTALKPGWRTLGLFVPVVNVFMVYHLFRLVYLLDDSTERAPSFRPGPLTFVYFSLVGLSNLPGLWALTFLTVVPMLPVQAELNRYWTSELPTARMRLRYTPAEMVVMALGAGMLMVFLASLASGV